MLPGARLTPCPRCGFVDAVLSVPAAHAAASNTEAALRVVHDTDSGWSRRDGARVTAGSALPIAGSRDLAPVPGAHVGFYGCLCVVAGVATVAMFVIYATATDHDAGDSVLLVAGSVAGVLAALGLVMAIRALVRQPTLRAGRPAAMAIWRRGWYCYRCAVVYFGSGEEPAGVGHGQPLTPPQFRHIVWGAGGFGGSTGP